jgi:hypothetical protein
MITAMTRYGQFCPLAKASEIVAERWTLLIIRELLAGSTRFNDLRRGVPLMSPALLSQRLQQLERDGIIERRLAERAHVDPAVFGPGRVVVAFEFTDLPRSQRHWWLVNSGDDVDLCPKDPGFDVDIHVVTRLSVMTKIWVGALDLNTAIRDGSVEFGGTREQKQQFRAWLLLSPFARPGDRKASPPEAGRIRRKAGHGPGRSAPGPRVSRRTR